MTLLSIAQDASREIGLDVPSTVVGNLDNNVAQLLRLATKEGRELVRRYDWQVLQTEKTFSALNQETQTSMIPTDFSRFINETFYNRTRRRTLAGPLTPQEWQANKSLTTTVVIDAFRRRGNDVLIIPSPTASDSLVYEYISKNWIDTDADGAADAETFADDTDTILLDTELVTMGLIWRYKMSRGFDYAEDFRSYEIQFARLTGDDGGKRVMDLQYPRRLRAPIAPQVQEGSWDL